MCMYACMYMYDVLVEIGGEGEGEKGLKPATNMRRESRLVLREIVYGGTGMCIQAGTFELVFVWMSTRIVAVDSETDTLTRSSQ